MDFFVGVEKLLLLYLELVNGGVVNVEEGRSVEYVSGLLTSDYIVCILAAARAI